ncbi:MAG: hypothetical protein OQK71_00660 [Desulfobacter sp.]|jgi:hypothetical protein|uniref:hypothetical protein n=1 Tax=uncultured Desulfobacter sp. TaxID=240139 RepID=UPI0029C80575|nr:hypothetical protein [uncultured Desulfobacter sp.]MCW8799414.1 hypothetical protein [Desulfobacter sp.]
MLDGILEKSKKPILILAGFLLVAILINFAVLEVFNQKSSYRAVHSLVGIIMLMGFVCTFSSKDTSRFKILLLFLVSLIPCYLGTVFSDFDIKLFGIGSHRNPVFHSGIIFFILLLVARRLTSFLPAVIISAFGLGLGSHLVWDLFDHADVRWIPGGTLDSLWLGVNGLLCILLARAFLNSRLKKV